MAAASIPSYVYRQELRLNFVDVLYGASHFQDLPLLFNEPCFVMCDPDEPHTFTPMEAALGKKLRAAWARFAAGEKPQGSGSVTAWPPFENGPLPDQQFIGWTVPSVVVRSYRDPPDVCDALWSRSS